MGSRLVLSVAILAVLTLGLLLIPAKPAAAETVCFPEADGCTWTCVTVDGFGIRRRSFNLCH
jgi:hypothetical protein